MIIESPALLLPRRAFIVAHADDHSLTTSIVMKSEKRGSKPLAGKVEKGFYQACEDLQPEKCIVIYPEQESFPLKNDVTAMPLPVAANLIRDQS